MMIPYIFLVLTGFVCNLQASESYVSKYGTPASKGSSADFARKYGVAGVCAPNVKQQRKDKQQQAKAARQQKLAVKQQEKLSAFFSDVENLQLVSPNSNATILDYLRAKEKALQTDRQIRFVPLSPEEQARVIAQQSQSVIAGFRERAKENHN